MSFTCRVEGQTPFNVEWIRSDGRPLPSRASVDSDYTLTIRDVKSTDAGRYICNVVGPGGRQQEEGELVVVGKVMGFSCILYIVFICICMDIVSSHLFSVIRSNPATC